MRPCGWLPLTLLIFATPHARPRVRIHSDILTTDSHTHTHTHTLAAGAPLIIYRGWGHGVRRSRILLRVIGSAQRCLFGRNEALD
ncbi:hypothetical protein V8F33_003118 [Rhypophila sp. PSN 637]